MAPMSKERKTSKEKTKENKNENKIIFKSHRLAVFTHLKPFLFVLLIPLLKAGVQFLADGKADNIIISESVLAILIVAYAVLKQKNFLLKVTKESLFIRSGFLAVRNAEIKLKRISSVELVRNPLDFIFSAATVQINTEAGRKGKADYSFKLSVWSARELQNIITDRENGSKMTIKFSPVKIALAAAATSSTVTGMIIAVPIISRAGTLLGMAVDQMLINGINDVSNRFSNYIPPIVNTVTLIFLFFYLASFCYTFLKSAGFKLILKKNCIDVSAGLIVRKNISLKKSAVNSVSIEQTPLMMLLKKGLLRVEIGGYGGVKGEIATVIPASDSSTIKREAQMLFPQFEFLAHRTAAEQTVADTVGTASGTEDTGGGQNNQVNEKGAICCDAIRTGEKIHSLFRLLAIPFYWFAAVMVAYPIFAHIFSPFSDLVGFLTAVTVGIICYRFFLCFYNYRRGEVRFGRVVYARQSKGVKTRQMYCDAEKIGMITLTEYPLDRREKTCKLKITMRSESSDYMTVKCLSVQKVKRQIAELYGIYKF